MKIKKTILITGNVVYSTYIYIQTNRKKEWESLPKCLARKSWNNWRKKTEEKKQGIIKEEKNDNYCLIGILMKWGEACLSTMSNDQ